MTNFFGGVREDDDPDKKPELEDFDSTKVASEVRMQCLTHKATILPFVGSLVGLGWSLVIHVSAISAGLTVAGIFIGTSAFIWNYFVNGEKKVQAHYARLFEAKRRAQLHDFRASIEEARKLGFAIGAMRSEALLAGFQELESYIGSTDANNAVVKSFLSRASAAFEEGCRVLMHAVNVYKGMQTLDGQSLETELAVLKAGLAQISEDETEDRAVQSRHIKTAELRLETFQKKQKQLNELLALAEEIDSAIRTTHMGLYEIGSDDPATFLSRDGDASQQLISAFEAARAIETSLRGGGLDAVDSEEMQMLRAAAK